VIALIEQNRDALVRLCRQFRVERLELFGSTVKGTFQLATSDVDFLVTFADAQPGTYADRYLGLLLALEQLFQREIDLVTERSIRNPYFRKAVEATRQLVYDGRGEEVAA
jgi:uncharacterized protein